MKIIALAPLLLAPFLLGAQASGGELQVQLTGLRNAKGVLLLCLSANPKHFPDCTADPAAKTLTVRASQPAPLTFADVPAGRYALSVMHDENGNRKLDTMMSIPREGFGFSRNPVVRFGPPKFRDVVFPVVAKPMSVPVTMRYFL